MQGGWKNAKHRYQWRQTLSDDYIASLRPLAVSTIETEDVLRVLQPIWQMLDWAKANKHREGENPAR
jgi:hypothetical protein